MDVNINKDITKIQESLILGLPIRESVFAVLTIAVGFLTYRGLTSVYEPDDSITFITAAVSAPFAAMGFYKYQGLTAEKILLEFIRSFLITKIVVLEPENYYGKKLKQMRTEKQKEMLKNDKIASKEKKRKKNRF